MIFNFKPLIHQDLDGNITFRDTASPQLIYNFDFQSFAEDQSFQLDASLSVVNDTLCEPQEDEGEPDDDIQTLLALFSQELFDSTEDGLAASHFLMQLDESMPFGDVLAFANFRSAHLVPNRVHNKFKDSSFQTSFSADNYDTEVFGHKRNCISHFEVGSAHLRRCKRTKLAKIEPIIF